MEALPQLHHAKGHDQIVGSVNTAAATSDRISLNLVNRKTCNRLKRLYVDEESDEQVECDD